MSESETLRNIGPDGEKIVDMSYYEILGVHGDANETELRKAYRKAAIRWHPDKNIGNPEAQEKFQELSEAFSVLSDSNLRAVYNKQGKKKENAVGEDAMDIDPAKMFTEMFGGQAFTPWIGELSMGKDLNTAQELATEEEKEAVKKEMNETEGLGDEAAKDQQNSADAVDVKDKKSDANTTQPMQSNVKLTDKQKEKLRMYEKDRVEEKLKRIKTLANQLTDRIRPLVESRNIDDPEDPDVKRFLLRMQDEVTDLAAQSFGVELCHLIGDIYISKASTYIKLHRSAGSNLLGVPGFFSRMKEKSKTLKEGWGFLSVGLDVHSAMMDLEKRQASGQLDEDEQRRVEQELSGQMLLVSWKGTQFELSAVLRQVVKLVLTKDKTVSSAILMRRAKAILLLGAMFRQAKSESSDDERRELERLVEKAAQDRRKKSKKRTPIPTTISEAVPSVSESEESKPVKESS